MDMGLDGKSKSEADRKRSVGEEPPQMLEQKARQKIVGESLLDPPPGFRARTHSRRF